MSEENKFWINILSLMTVCLLGITFTIGICDAFRGYIMLQMVKSGADPIRARCATHGSGERDAAMCTLVAQVKS